MKKLLLIINPRAGMRKVNRALTDIVDIFNRGGYEVTAHVTADRGDAVRLAEQYAEQVDLVVCAGGDGTFNETITGVFNSGADVEIGYSPCGSTNDFASSLKLSANVVQAAKDIVDGEVFQYDVGRFGQRYFSYVASFGAFTRASYSTPQNVKNALGHVAYILGGIQELSQIRKEHVRFELDGRVIEDDFLFGAISNSTSMGGILTLDPKQVDMCDGEFELLLVRSSTDPAEVAECIVALTNQRYNCAMVTFVRAKKLKVYANPDMPWTLDGEREDGHQVVEVENLPGMLHLRKRG